MPCLPTSSVVVVVVVLVVVVVRVVVVVVGVWGCGAAAPVPQLIQPQEFRPWRERGSGTRTDTGCPNLQHQHLLGVSTDLLGPSKRA